MSEHVVDHKDLIAFLNAMGRDRCKIVAIDGMFLKITVDDHRKPCDKQSPTTEGKTMDIYKENGYENRKEYLKCLADDYGVDIETVKSLAQLLGPSEDFDGLVTTLQDYSGE